MWNLASIFAAVFLAELGDKTQLATLLFASDGKSSPFGVFMAAALALCLSTGIAVLLGSVGARYLQGIPLEAHCRHRLHRYRPVDNRGLHPRHLSQPYRTPPQR